MKHHPHKLVNFIPNIKYNPRFYKLRKKLTVVCLAILTQMISTNAMSLPKETSTVFDVARNGLSMGYLKSTLKYQGQTYEYSKFTQSTGLAKFLTKASITEKVVGKHSGQRLIPVSYSLDQKTRKKQVLDQARFSWNRASGMYKGNAYSSALIGGWRWLCLSPVSASKPISMAKP